MTDQSCFGICAIPACTLREKNLPWGASFIEHRHIQLDAPDKMRRVLDQRMTSHGQFECALRARHVDRRTFQTKGRLADPGCCGRRSIDGRLELCVVSHRSPARAVRRFLIVEQS